jgi:hypothetical protein
MICQKAPTTIAARSTWLQVGNLLGVVSVIPVPVGVLERESPPVRSAGGLFYTRGAVLAMDGTPRQTARSQWRAYHSLWQIQGRSVTQR